MASDDARCVGCGDSVQPDQRRILANNSDLEREMLKELNLKINERNLL